MFFLLTCSRDSENEKINDLLEVCHELIYKRDSFIRLKILLQLFIVFVPIIVGKIRSILNSNIN